MIKAGIIVSNFSENVIRQIRGFQLVKLNNVSIEIITSDGVIPLEKLSYDFNFKLNTNKLFFLKLFRLTYKTCKLKKYDVIMNLSGMGYTVPITCFIGKITKTPFILMYSGDHRILLKRYLPFYLTNLINFFMKKIQECCFKKADNIITLGKNGKKLLAKLGINEKKIIEIPCFIDTEKFYPVNNKKKYKQKIGLNIHKKTIIYVGRLTKSKGSNNLLKIINLVNKQNKNKFEFMIIGEGSYFNKLKLIKNVKVFGRIDPKIINNYYFAADLLLHPSLSEGLPNTILEALSCNVPVTATPVGEIPNIVSNTFKDPNDFAKYILKEKWKIDKIPFNNKILLEKYQKLFNKY